MSTTGHLVNMAALQTFFSDSESGNTLLSEELKVFCRNFRVFFQYKLKHLITVDVKNYFRLDKFAESVKMSRRFFIIWLKCYLIECRNLFTGSGQ